jgi:hypothetical protein
VADAPPSAASFEEYGRLFRSAYSLLHTVGREPLGEELTDRPPEAVARALFAGLRATSPPAGLEEAHTLIIALLEGAIQVWAALEAQLQGYLRNDFAESERHAEEVARLVSNTAQIDQRLMACLASLERARPGTLQALGLSPPWEADTTPEEDLP